MLQDRGSHWQLGTFGGKRELGEGSKECAARETEEESAGVLNIQAGQKGGKAEEEDMDVQDGEAAGAGLR